MKTELRFGKPNSYDYDSLIDQFSGTKINSIKTSSVPLVQFWKETELRIQKMSNELELPLDNFQLCFEYPTPSKGKGKSSMTDLMIIANETKVAIEAKYTEYLKRNRKTELISSWKENKNKENRKDVLQHWIDIIKPFSNSTELGSFDDIEYQFFHRTASACYKSTNPFVIYQVFYDYAGEGDMNELISSLKTYIGKIKPKENLRFYIWKVNTCLKHPDANIDNVFMLMKNTDIYSFISDELFEIR